MATKGRATPDSPRRNDARLAPPIAARPRIPLTRPLARRSKRRCERSSHVRCLVMGGALTHPCRFLPTCVCEPCAVRSRGGSTPSALGGSLAGVCKGRL